MVPPLNQSPPRNERNSARRAAAASALTLAGLAASGCSFVPKTKLDESHRIIQTLRADNGRLKDLALDLRSQNQDLSQRAVDDATRLSAQHEAIDRLEQSVTGYQSERDALAAAFETLKRQVRVAVSAHPAARSARLKAFADAHPGWTFDPAAVALSAPPDLLFEPAGSTLKPDAADALKALAVALEIPDEPGSSTLSLEVVGPADAPPVVLAGFDPSDDPVKPASARFLSAARAARVRDALVAATHLDPSRARLAPPPPAEPDASTPRRVEIRFGDAPLTTPSPRTAAEPSTPPAPEKPSETP